MATIRRTPKGKWKAQVLIAPGRFKSKTHSTRLLAQQWARGVEAARDRGEVDQPVQVAAADGDLTVAAYWEGFVLPARRARLAPNTVARNLSHWRNQVGPAFGHRPLVSVRRAEVNRWVTEKINDGMGVPTIRASLELLSGIFAAAVDDDLLAQHPTRGIRLPKHQAADRGYLSRDEVARILGEVAEPYRLFLELTVETGLRFGEAAGIKREAVLREGRQIKVASVLTRHGVKDVPKTASSRRVVPVPEHLRARLLTAIMKAPPGTLVFTGAHGGGLSDSNLRQRVLGPACERAGVRRVTLHHLRHAYASWLTEQGVSPFEVARALGHSSLRMQERYAHLAPGADDRVLAALDASRGA